MDYFEAINYLEGFKAQGIKPRLSEARNLLESMGFNYPGKIVHVAGTNGKGSCATVLAKILQESGFKVGLYTSPELVDFRERIKVNEAMISEELFCEVCDLARQAIEARDIEPTFFEVTTCMALHYFTEQKVDIMVLEVGLGGRLDATNIVDSDISIITSIDRDHVEYLGGDLDGIAREKAGVITPNTKLITAAHDPGFSVLEEVCKEIQAEIIDVNSRLHSEKHGEGGVIFKIELNNKTLVVESPLHGLHQVGNLGCAIVAAKHFDVTDQTIILGVKETVYPGRFQILQIQPKVIVDCAHNPAGIYALRETLRAFDYAHLIIVAGFSRDKEIKPMVDALSDADKFIATKSPNPRAVEPLQVTKILGDKTKTIEIPSVDEAIIHAMSQATREDIILVTGSIFLVGHVLKLWRNM